MAQPCPTFNGGLIRRHLYDMHVVGTIQAVVVLIHRWNKLVAAVVIITVTEIVPFIESEDNL